MKEAYPLTWPVGYKRTKYRIRSRFDQTMDKAQRSLRDELTRLGAREIVVSTNLRLRSDGMIYAADLNKNIEDPGVAIYFKYKGKDVSMCCDQYSRVWENIYALAKGIEALRGMERWGVSEFLDRAFTGFTALPESAASISCWQILGFERPTHDKDLIKRTYLLLAKKVHPDTGGSTSAFQELNEAYRIAMAY